MKRLKKTLITLLILVATVLPMGAQTAYAQLTILPSAGSVTMEECIREVNDFEVQTDAAQKEQFKDADWKRQILGCAIKTGRISLNMIPHYVTYVSNFFLSLIGLICVLFIVIGGYYYIYGGLTEAKEKGKKTIYHALLGMALAILSWVIVNIVIVAITS